MSDSNSFAGVRLARPEDEDAIYDLLRPMHAENGIMALSERKVRETIANGTRGRGGVVGVIDGPDGLEASIGLSFATFWYTDDCHLLELWHYVHADHRATTHAKRLIEYGKWVSDRLSASGTKVPLMFGTITRHRLLPKIRLYQRHAPQIGVAFMHGLDVPDTFSQRTAADVPAFRPALVKELH